MKNSLIKITLGIVGLVGFVTAMSLAFNQKDLNAINPSSSAWTRLIQNLHLTNDAAQPSGLISDEAFRTQMQTRLINDVADTTCTHFQSVQNVAHGSQALLYLIHYSFGISGTRYAALMRIPQNRKNLPIVLYAHSGYKPLVEISEPETILGASLDKVVLVIPLFFGDKYRYGANSGFAVGSKDDNNLYAESRLMYGLARCLQNQSEQFVQSNTKPLSDVLQKAYYQHGGYRLALTGAGRGGLLVAQTAAMAGATMMAGKSAIADVVHVDAVVQVNPLQGLVGAENRLWLASLVGGYLNETRYGLVPGVSGFDKFFASPYRRGVLNETEMKFEVAKRDANILAPFINLGVKNYAFPANTKGLRAGGMLTLQAKKRGDFTANGSRIFSNVLATVQFATTKQTNGMNHLYREFLDEAGEAAIHSYQNIFSNSFLNARSQQIDDIFIVLSDSTRSADKNYRWLMRGRAFAVLGENQPARLLQDFLASTIGAK